MVISSAEYADCHVAILSDNGAKIRSGSQKSFFYIFGKPCLYKVDNQALHGGCFIGVRGRAIQFHPCAGIIKLDEPDPEIQVQDLRIDIIRIGLDGLIAPTDFLDDLQEVPTYVLKRQAIGYLCSPRSLNQGNWNGQKDREY